MDETFWREKATESLRMSEGGESQDQKDDSLEEEETSSSPGMGDGPPLPEGGCGLDPRRSSSLPTRLLRFVSSEVGMTPSPRVAMVCSIARLKEVLAIIKSNTKSKAPRTKSFSSKNSSSSSSRSLRQLSIRVKAEDCILAR